MFVRIGECWKSLIIYFIVIYLLLFFSLYRRERFKQFGDNQNSAQKHSDKTWELYQRLSLSSHRTFRRYPATVTSLAVNLVANDRTNTIRQVIRDGAYRQSASRDILWHYIGSKWNHHIHTDLKYCARKLHEQQWESYQSFDASQYR